MTRTLFLLFITAPPPAQSAYAPTSLSRSAPTPTLALWALFVWEGLNFSPKESSMHEGLNKIYLQNLFTNECNFV
jgi:hypothetical protein